MVQSIPKEFINHLLEKVNIVDVINGYVKLEKKGNDYWARCPFHNEKTSSFSVSESKQFYYCFGCGATGNAITFIMEHTNKTYPEAIEELANSVGMDIPRTRESNEKYEAKKTIQNALEDAKKLFRDNLKRSDKAINYLKNRNISGNTAKQFEIGYSEDDFHNLSRTLGENYSESNLIDAGLLVKKDKNSYDKFRDRIMFPIFDIYGKVIAFGGRDISGDKKIDVAKYMNSPETSLFSKKKVLYNLHIAKADKISKDTLLIVEGYMDVIALHQSGVNNVVATLGTAVTPDNLEQCFKYTKEIICCFDGDRAGKDAAWKGVRNIMSVIKDGNNISFVFLPEGRDPDDIVNEGGKDLWLKYIEKKVSLEDFIYNKYSDEVNLETAAGKTQYLQKIEELLKPLKAPIFKKILHESLNDRIGSKYLPPSELKDPKKEKISSNKAKSPLQKAILILLHHPSINIDEELLSDKRIASNEGVILLKSIAKNISESHPTNLGRIIENFRNDEKNYKTLEKISVMETIDLEWPEKEFNACLCLVIKNFLKEELKNVDPLNLEKFSNIQREIYEIQEKAKNY